MSYVDDFLSDVVLRSHDPAIILDEFSKFVAWVEAASFSFLPSVYDFWEWLYNRGYDVDAECRSLANAAWADYEADYAVEFEDAARGIRLSRVSVGCGLDVDGEGVAGLDLPKRTRMWERPLRGRGVGYF